MTGTTVSRAEATRRALLALAAQSSSADPAGDAAAIPVDWFLWLPTDRARRLFHARPAPPSATPDLSVGKEIAGQPADDPTRWLGVEVDRQLAEQLAAVDQIRSGQRSLRVGWLFVVGAVDDRGAPRRVVHPLITRPVQARRTLLSAFLQPTGDVEISPLVPDPDDRARLEQSARYGGTGLGSFAREAARAAGFDVDVVVPVDGSPEAMAQRDGLAIVAGLAVYSHAQAPGFSPAGSLRRWTDANLNLWTAFHTLYLGEPPAPRSSTHGPAPPPAPPEPVESPFPLTPVQRRAVGASRAQPVTVLAGAPGTGKSHTIAAIAVDALAHDRSVLVAARAGATVDAMVALLGRAPGPDPVVFGSNDRRSQLVAKLVEDHPLVSSDEDRADAASELHAVLAARDRVWHTIAGRLEDERAFESATPGLAEARLARPSLFDGRADLAEIRARAELAARPTSGPLSRRRQQRHLRALDERGEPLAAGEVADFLRLVDLAEGQRRSARLRADGGLDLSASWEELVTLDEAVRVRLGRWVESESRAPNRRRHPYASSVDRLAAALRNGRAVRRQQLASLARNLTRALPLWVGTLADIDELLPMVPALFDLVILDGAACMDQPSAATALLRAGRAVVVGDPHQLRPPSFLSDAERDAALAEARIGPRSPLAAKLDVRRNSALDLAAGAVAPLVLDEEFRSLPHLVDFAARRLYQGRVRAAATSPATEEVDCIDVVPVDGRRDEHGVVTREVRRVVSLLRDLRNEGATSVGVISPFRAQADAVEAAVLKAFALDDIEALDLRIGTVHAFQGHERDVVIASIGAGERASAGTWQFVQGRRLFTVLVTRARRRFVVVMAGAPPPGGLLADYLAEADGPPGRAPSDPAVGPWALALAEDLDAGGTRAVAGYRSGRHVIDVCVGDATDFVGIECTVHPDGPDAHIERHLALCRAGWRLREAFPSRWAGRRHDLLAELRRPPPARAGA